MADAASRVGRDPTLIRLVAVSKTFDIDAVIAAADAGQIDFGENKIQEALPKIEGTARLGLRWHLVGHLQSNKAKKAGEQFHTIHSIDSAALGAKVEQAAASVPRTVEMLVQVDLAGEPTKHGVPESDLMPIFDAARQWHACRVKGLMALPPATDTAEGARRYFRALKSVRDRLLARGVNPSMLAELSMGMSHDFEVAIEEGATIVRVGTAIFGRRSPGNFVRTSNF
jgi:pyridoxal phosphate enzyme (YggS family)